MTELTVITDRGLKYEYVRKLREKSNLNKMRLDIYCDDEIISFLDWTIRNQCPECHTYFDNGDGVDDDRFCCNGCQVVYVEEAPDREER